MKQASKILLTVFSVGVLLSLLAGALSFFGYLVAMILGGQGGTDLSLFIYEKYFPWVIRLSSVSVLLGLVGMMLQKKKALVVTEAKEEENEEQKEPQK